MPGPCPLALSLTRVPAKRWATRADLAERLDVAFRLLWDQPERTWRTRELAESVCLSHDHFIELFRMTYGMSPAALRSRIRLERAREWIESGLSPSDAAYRVGYSSLGTFSRQFRARFGVSPRSIMAPAKTARPQGHGRPNSEHHLSSERPRPRQDERR